VSAFTSKKGPTKATGWESHRGGVSGLLSLSLSVVEGSRWYSYVQHNYGFIQVLAVTLMLAKRQSARPVSLL